MELFREYETVALLHPDMLEDGVQRFNHRVSEAVGKEQGVLLKVESWGKKKLAYEVKKESKSIYAYYRYLGSPKVVNELERILSALRPRKEVTPRTAVLAEEKTS